MTNIEAFELAKRKARFGHKDWIVWLESEGVYRAEKRSPSAIKKALLANGTKGRRWWVISASSCVPSIGFWAMGLNMIRQSRYGW